MSEKPHRILVVDDEPDVLAVTRLGLKGLRYGGRGVELAGAASGREAVEAVRARPDTAAILLDVVMETETAGLDACRAIRGDLGNAFVRILLRTGQPGVAPEKRTIEEFDIDGYLPKAELTSNRLFAAVRTAIKAYEELVELDRHRSVLASLHQSVAALHAYEPLDVTLRRVLEIAVELAPAALAHLDLATFDEKGDPREFTVSLSTDPDRARAEAALKAASERLRADASASAGRGPGPFGDGFLVPLTLHRELGRGWVYLERPRLDAIAEKALPLLAAHASNALYAAIAQELLARREGPFFDSLSV